MKKILFVLLFIALVFSACLPASVEPTQDIETIVQATFQALTLQALEPAQPTSTPSSEVVSTSTTITITTGSIAGTLIYPSSFIPAQTIVAFDVNSQSYYYVMTIDGQSSYQIDNLPSGNYRVVSYTLNDPSFSAGYSQAVPCGLLATCSDHSLIVVTVTAGEVTNGVNPHDWYAPPNTFPAYPLP